MKERHRTQNQIKAQLTNYWGERILAQMLYLEEMALCGDGLDALLDALTADIQRRLEEDGAITKQAALALEKSMEPASPRAKAITVSCVGHAHIDMNWMWSFDETASVAVDTLRTMLMLMREYPGFTFAQSQASVYRLIEEYAPEMLPEIRERIREGRWEVTASTWVELDKNMTSGESQTRHLLYTRRYLKELLGLADDQFQIDFEPDTFGHNFNVPEILSTGGVKYYYHCRGYEGHHLYRWRAPSGAEVKVFREPTWYNDTIAPDTFQYIPSFCKRNGLDRMLHVYGVGDHGGGVTRRDIERILDMSTWPCMPSLQFGRFLDFFTYLDTLELPVVDSELNFIFDGCYTTQTRIKKANRVSESALYEAEALNTFSQLCGKYPYNAKTFAAAWEPVLFSHFHDILPGSCVIATREYALGMFQKTMACAGTRKSAAVRALSAAINTAALLPEGEPRRDSRAEGAGVGFGVSGFNYTASSTAGGGKRLFNLFNTTQTAKTTPSLITVWDWPGDISKAGFVDENGEHLEFEILDKAPLRYWDHYYFRALVLCEIEPFGYRTVKLEETRGFVPVPIKTEWHVDTLTEFVLENELVRAVFDSRDARLISFTDKETGEEYIDKTGGGVLRYIEEDDVKGMTAWCVGRYMNVTPIITDVKLTDVSGSLRRTLSFTAPVKNSKLKVTVALEKNSRILEYSAECDWREFGEPGKMIPQLSFCAPLSFDCNRFVYDTAFGAAERAGMDYDVPGLSFAFAPRGGHGGLMLLSRDKYGYRCKDNSMSLTLIRSAYEPDGIPECYQHEFAFGIGIIKDTDTKSLLQTSLSFNHPAVTVAAEAHTGSLPLSGSFLRLEESEAVISSVKMQEDGGAGVILRFCEVSGKDGSAVFVFQEEPQSAVYVDAHERELDGGAPVIAGKTLTARMSAYAVTAVKIVFKE